MDVFTLLNQQFKDIEISRDSVESCPECGGDNVDIDENKYVCMDCGCIKNEQILDSRQDKCGFSNGEAKGNDPSTQGSVSDPLLPKFSMSTMIAGPGSKFYRKMHNWTIPYEERALWKIFEVIQSKCSNCDLPQSIAQKAKEYYKEVRNKKITRGKIREAIIASCVYTACKNKGVPRNTKEIADIFSIPQSLMIRGLKEFTNIMGNDLEIEDTRPTNFYDFLERYCNKLYIKESTVEVIRKVLRKADKLQLIHDNTPPAILGGTIYFTCEVLSEKINKDNLAKICGVSPITINKVANKLKEHEEKIFKINYVVKGE
jgi:transcription initiation factor TFIIB